MEKLDSLATVLGWYRMKGKQLGIPHGIDTEFIAYNKALLDEAGVSSPEDGWTLEEFVEKAKALTIDRDGDVDSLSHTAQNSTRVPLHDHGNPPPRISNSASRRLSSTFWMASGGGKRFGNLGSPMEKPR